MLKLMIVDDERFPRDCMATQIPWGNYSVELTGTAGDGAEALRLIQENPPDVVITDIKMPEMDGIEFLTEVKRRWPEIQAIIISGYEEFDYARRAMALGVENYILKPVDPDELLAAVLKIIERKSAEAAEREIGPVEEYLRSMLYACYTPERGDAAMRHFQDLNDRYFFAVVLQLDNMSKALKGHPKSAYSLLEAAAKGFCARVPETFFADRSPHNMVFVIAAEEEERAESAADSLIETIRERLKKSDYRDYAIGVSKMSQGAGTLGNIYLDALRAVNMKYIYGNGKSFYSGEQRDINALSVGAVDHVHRVLESTERGDAEALDAALSEQLLDFRKNNACRQDVRQFARSVIGALMERLGEMDVQINDVFSDPATLLFSICMLEDPGEIGARLSELLKTVSRFLREKEGSNPEQICQSAKRIIEKNYADVNLSTKSIAEMLHFSAAYLSALFSASCRTTITNYINKVRVENAMALLRTSGMKVGSISKMVGYENNTYFCSVFKRITGVSPTDYRAAKDAGQR